MNKEVEHTCGSLKFALLVVHCVRASLVFHHFFVGFLKIYNIKK